MAFPQALDTNSILVYVIIYSLYTIYRIKAPNEKKHHAKQTVTISYKSNNFV